MEKSAHFLGALRARENFFSYNHVQTKSSFQRAPMEFAEQIIESSSSSSRSVSWPADICVLARRHLCPGRQTSVSWPADICVLESTGFQVFNLKVENQS